MKKFIQIKVLLALLIMVFAVYPLYADEEKTDEEKEDEPRFKPEVFTVDGEEYEAYVLWVDMKDGRNYVDVGLAEGKIGSLEDLKSIAKREEDESEEDIVLGAINGTFFNMTDGASPINTIMKDGKLKYASNWASLATFNGENEMKISNPMFRVMGSINGQWDWPYGFIAKTVNKFSDEKYGVSIIDESFNGEIPDRKLYVVAVQNGEVVGVYDEMPIEIPKDGYLIVSRYRFTLTDIHVGDSVDYVYKAFDNTKETREIMSFYNVRTALGAGPTLVKDGEISINLKQEGFSDWSIYNNRQRSMVGMTEDKKLAFVVSESISLDALSKLAVQLGLKNAMNLDGGGSAGLVIDGEYAMEPLRKVSNALVVKRRKQDPIRIVINQVEHFFDTNPYIYNKRTMVPLRGILESLGCQLEWNSETEEVTVTRYGEKLVFKKNSTLVKGKNRDYKMDVPLLIKDSRSAISVRFLTEFMGGEVEWNPEKRLVDIRIDTTKELYEIAKSLFENQKSEISLQFFEKVLKLNSNHIGALKHIGILYEESFKDYRTAAKYYRKMLELYEDHDMYIRLLKSYILGNDGNSALDLVIKLEEKGYDTPEYYYYSAKVYENFDTKKAFDNYSSLIEIEDIDREWYIEARNFIRMYEK